MVWYFEVSQIHGDFFWLLQLFPVRSNVFFWEIRLGRSLDEFIIIFQVRTKKSLWAKNTTDFQLIIGTISDNLFINWSVYLRTFGNVLFLRIMWKDFGLFKQSVKRTPYTCHSYCPERFLIEKIKSWNEYNINIWIE